MLTLASTRSDKELNKLPFFEPRKVPSRSILTLLPAVRSSSARRRPHLALSLRKKRKRPPASASGAQQVQEAETQRLVEEQREREKRRQQAEQHEYSVRRSRNSSRSSDKAPRLTLKILPIFLS